MKRMHAKEQGIKREWAVKVEIKGIMRKVSRKVGKMGRR